MAASGPRASAKKASQMQSRNIKGFIPRGLCGVLRSSACSPPPREVTSKATTPTLYDYITAEINNSH